MEKVYYRYVEEPKKKKSLEESGLDLWPYGQTEPVVHMKMGGGERKREEGKRGIRSSSQEGKRS